MPHVILTIPLKCPKAKTRRFWQSGRRRKRLWSGNPATLRHGSTGALLRVPASALLMWQSGQPSSTFRQPSTAQSLLSFGMRPPFRISQRFTR